MKENSIRRTLILFVLMALALPALAQEHYIDLGTDTIYYDKHFEYTAAFEMEKYMESYIFFHSAMEAYQAGDLFGAKASISKAIKLNKDEIKFLLLKSWILSREKSYKRAIKLVNSILESHPNNQEALYCKALNQYLLKDFLGANITYSEIISINEQHEQAYFGRAEAKMELEDFAGAIADYNAALSIKPTLALAYEGRGLAFFKTFEFRAAIKDFNQFLVADPTSGKSHYYRGMAHLRLNEFSQACTSFAEARKLKYKDASEYYSKYCNF